MGPGIEIFITTVIRKEFIYFKLVPYISSHTNDDTKGGGVTKITRKTIYIIKLDPKKWKQYNGMPRRKGYRSVMIDERFLDDPKIKSLVPTERLLFLACILACGQSDLGECQVSVDLLCSQSGVKPGLISSCLQRLESLRLLTFEKLEPLYKENIKEKEKRRGIEKEIPAGSSTPPVQGALIPEPPKKTSTQIWKAYEEAFVVRYKEKPTRNAKANTAAKKILDSIGEEEGVELVKFYLTHTDSLYLKSMHELSVCAMHVHALTIQRRKGIKFTSSDVRRFEKEAEHQAQLDRLGDQQ